MPLINTSVPNLIQGVSQQPDATRFAGQCEEQENALSSVAEGLKKRPNTRHVARLLTSAISTNAKVHFINRSEEEKYVVIHDGSLRIFNLETGVEATLSGSSAYLTSSTPKDDIEFTTVADYTYILNKTKTVALSASLTPDYGDEIICFVKQGDYEKVYRIDFVRLSDGVSRNATCTTATSDAGNTNFNADTANGGQAPNTGGIIAALVVKLQTELGVSNASGIGKSTLWFKGAAAPKVSDDLAGGALGLCYKVIDSITSLPVTGLNNFTIKVRGDTEVNQDDYYVTFKTNTNQIVGDGTWIETVEPNSVVGLDASTMPHQLVNTGVNQFTLQAGTFEERQAGDNDTNPHPSFVGKKINEIFFHKNRLGYITSDTVCLSAAGSFYSHYRATVTTFLDDAPIDVNVSSTKVTELKHAVGFQGDLMLFSDNAQFVLKGSELLTPKTVSISATTSFNVESDVPPLALGSYIYFPFTRGQYTGVNEYSTNANTENFNANEITEHVPAYIPKNIKEMAGSTSENIMVLVSSDGPRSMYVYNYFWDNNQKVLSAWSKFTFTEAIRGMEFIDSTLYMVVVNNGETHLVEMPLESGLTDDIGYITHLDMRVEKTVSNGGTSITLPYTPANNSVEVYTKDGLKLSCTNIGSTVTLAQAVVGNTDVWVGIPYTMKYTFSEQLFKAKAGKGSSPSNAAKMRIRNGSVYYADTSYFKVSVTPKQRSTYENVFTPDVVGSSTLGSLTLSSGFYRFPVFTKPQDTVITIENESALPSTFQSAEFESFVHSRSNRYG